MTQQQKKTTSRSNHDYRDDRYIAWMKKDVRAGFSRVAEVYWKQLCRVAANVLDGSPFTHLIEDVVQEGLLSAYRDLLYHRDKLDDLNLRAWLYEIVRNKARRCLAVGEKHLELSVGLLGHELEESVAEQLLVEYDDPGYLLERMERRKQAKRITRELLNGLPSMQRMVVERKYLSPDDGSTAKITYEQISKETNTPINTVKSHVTRGLKHMRKQLTEQRIEEYYLNQ